MPITSSAKKALRGSAKKRVYNLRRKKVLDETVKGLKKGVSTMKKAEAQTSLSAAYKAIDKALKGGLIKKNTAARKKSRLAALVKKSVK